MRGAINARGQVAGIYSASKYDNWNAFIIDTDGQNFHTLEGLEEWNSTAMGINDAGKFVGFYTGPYSNGFTRGFIADATGHGKPLANLMITSLPDSCNPFRAYDINNNNWIVGTCGEYFQAYAFLLIPEEIADVTPSRENSLSLSESQRDFLTCDADKFCTVATGETHQLSIKLSAATLSSQGIDLNQLKTTTPITIRIGHYSFSGSLESADPDKQQHTPSHLPATWSSKHDECKKYTPDNSCSRSVTVVDDIVNISADKKHNLSISIKGKMIYGNGNKFDQPIVADLCPHSSVGSSQVVDNALITIDSQPLPMPVKIDCKLKSTNKRIRQSQTTFTLKTLSLKASLTIDP